MFIFKNLRCLQPPHLHICLTMSAQPLNGRLLQQRLKQFRLPESKTETFCLKLLIQHWSHRHYWFRAYRLQFTWSCSYLKSSNLPQLFTFQSKAVPTFHWNTQSVVEFAKVVSGAFFSMAGVSLAEDCRLKRRCLLETWNSLKQLTIDRGQNLRIHF